MVASEPPEVLTNPFPKRPSSLPRVPETSSHASMRSSFQHHMRRAGGGVATGHGAGDNRSMMPRARLVGFNHVALEVGDIEEALEFYGRLFELKLRGRGPGMAFIDAGDQFIALVEEIKERPDDHRHIGMVVDDKRAVRR